MESIVCFTCGKVMPYQKFQKLCQTKSTEIAMNELGMRRFCCRRMLLTSIDVTQQVQDYNAVHNTIQNNPYVKIKDRYVENGKRVYSTN